MSTCLIISQGEKMYIGADTACSVKTPNGYRRFSNNMQKLFTIGNNVFFCSGKKQNVEECINWIYDSFDNTIDIARLELYLKSNFSTINKDNIFNIEFLLCDYDNYCIIQLSQYNNFKPVKYNKSNQLRIICGGYKTKDSFFIARNNILSRKTIKNVYSNVFGSISDECVGGSVVFFDSPVHCEKILVNERNIEYANSDNLFLLTSDFVTAGYINGSQIIGGEIYSTNFIKGSQGTYFDLINGDFQLAGGKFLYNSSSSKLTIKGVIVDWTTTTTPEISDIDGLTEDLEQKSASISANADAIAAEVKRASKAEGDLSASIKINADAITSEVKRATESEGNLSSKIEQTAESITSTVSKTYETKENAKNIYNTLETSITQTAESIELKVSKDSIISTINQSAEEVSIKANKISLEGIVTANNYFKILSDGSMVATNGTFTGTITAKNGSIAGFTISNEKLYAGTGEDNDGVMIQSCSSDSNRYWVFAAGSNTHVTYGKAPFRVSKYGELYSTKGYIGGFKITEGYLYNGITFGNANSCGMSSGTEQGGDDNNIFWAGNGNFRVAIDGYVYANNANIKGTILSDLGYIGGENGWTISERKITSNGFGERNYYKVSLSCPTQYGTIGNGYADVLVIKSEEPDGIKYPFVLSSNGDIKSNEWYITQNYLYIENIYDNTKTWSGMQKISNSYGNAAFFVGCNVDPASNQGIKEYSNFYVTHGGELYAKKIKNIVANSIVIPVSAANTPTSMVVSWDLHKTPFVTATPHSASPGTAVLGVSVEGISASGCTIWITRTNAVATGVNYIAIAN